MAGLAEPNPVTMAPGTLITGTIWNGQVRDALNYLLNPPMFQGYLSTGANVATGTSTQISLDTIQIDSYGGWAAPNYTIQVGGWYEIMGGVGFAANATGQRFVWIQSNGSTLEAESYVSLNAAAAGSTNIGTKPFHRYCNQGTTLQLMVEQNSGGTLATTLNPFLAVRWVHQ